ncbi:2-keto-4-pentenoate hydratase [Patulibacter minatonensis]|uniref:2-keto-4-pentenoate hydratase n=1 Tax=Patulibacter minatonensis TaxID=298163 RepID=UPI0004BA1651|nr:fumarylacetoacetate hydrolase family protein [Patulibacter minatonensis]
MSTTDHRPRSSAELDALARELLEAFESGTAVEPLTERPGGLDVDDAYRVQQRLVAGHAAAGRTVAGRKIGLTSLAMQRQLGVDEPDFGVVLDSHLFADGATFDPAAQRMVAPRLEPELAFVLGEELRGPGLTVEQVLAATAEIVPVFEVIDSRVVDWRITLPDTIADNASCFGAVLGAAVPLDAVGDLREIEVVMTHDGDEVGRATGEAVLGHPAKAVAWLAEAVGRFGEALPVGQPILAGSFTAAVPAAPGAYEARFSGAVGTVTATVGTTR